MFLFGILLLALELFVIPGFGVAGVLGIIFTVTGVTVALVENTGTDFVYVTTADILRALALVLVLLCTAIILVIWAAKFLVSSAAAYPIVDSMVQDKAQGYTTLRADFAELVGAEAVAFTDLRPVGHIHINGQQFDAEANEGYISKGQKVIVERLKGVHLIVKKLVVE